MPEDGSHGAMPQSWAQIARQSLAVQISLTVGFAAAHVTPLQRQPERVSHSQSTAAVPLVAPVNAQGAR